MTSLFNIIQKHERICCSDIPLECRRLKSLPFDKSSELYPY